MESEDSPRSPEVLAPEPAAVPAGATETPPARGDACAPDAGAAVGQRGKLTPAEIEARRKNAQKSTGPRTEAGKRRVSLNAFKHGLRSRGKSPFQARLDPDEDFEEFLGLLRLLLEARPPADEVEGMLVEDIARLAWRKRGLEQIQIEVEKRYLQSLEEALPDGSEVECDTPPASEAEVPGQAQLPYAERRAALAAAQASWALMLRHENALHRQIESKLRLLEQIRRAREAREAGEDRLLWAP